jgi:putative intracellular protease/amidase
MYLTTVALHAILNFSIDQLTMSPRAKLLVVLTSQDILPTRPGTKTGWYLPELVHPYNALSPHVDMIFASPKGGEAPIDPYSIEDSKNDEESQKFLKEKDALWKNTERLEAMLDRIDEFVGIFFVGGHGRRFSLFRRLSSSIKAANHVNIAMFDLATNSTSHALVRKFYENGQIVSAVCHGPAALVNVKLSDGTYMVQDQDVTGFSNAEEDAYNFTSAMPFLLEDEMKKHGGKYCKADQPFGTKVVISGKHGKLVTGQNPPSASVIGKTLVEIIQKL